MTVQKGVAAAGEGMSRASRGADPEWKLAALQIVECVSAQKFEFTADDILDALDHTPYSTHDNRALGPVMKNAERNGWCSPTDRFIRSARAIRHAQDMRVWRSNRLSGTTLRAAMITINGEIDAAITNIQNLLEQKLRLLNDTGRQNQGAA